MINQLPSPKSTKSAIKRGRGIGSGRGGHTAGRGTKGQKSRSGYSRPRPGFEGGQMPLSRRIAKLKGFSRGEFTKGVKRVTIKLSDIATKIKGDKVDFDTLIEAGLLTVASKKLDVKVLFDKNIDRKLVISGIPTSQSVKQAVEKAGGQVE
jgi:large subunit ribosomal protein L15